MMCWARSGDSGYCASRSYTRAALRNCPLGLATLAYAAAALVTGLPAGLAYLATSDAVAL